MTRGIRRQRGTTSRATSVAEAKRTLHRAFSELAQARGDDERIRQAAEKGWRAAREAVYAVLRAAGERVVGTVGSDFVRRVEQDKFSRTGGAVSDGYALAKDALHGGAFYDGTYESEDSIERSLDRVKELISECEYALVILRQEGT